MSGIEIRSAEKTLATGGRRFVLRIGRFHVEPGEILAVIGPSGSGKSTLLEVLGLVAAPGSATAFDLSGPEGRIDLLALWRLRDEAALAGLRAHRFGFVLQTGGLFPFLSVRENVALCQRLTGREDAAWLDMLIERLGLGARVAAMPAGLSIGERQRVAIARALAHRPAYVIADEPTSALDPGNAEAVLDLLLDCAAAQGTAVILSTHNHALFDRHAIECIAIERLGEEIPGTWVSHLERAA